MSFGYKLVDRVTVIQRPAHKAIGVNGNWLYFFRSIGLFVKRAWYLVLTCDESGNLKQSDNQADGAKFKI